MAQVIYPRPSPWSQLGPAIQSIMQPLVEMAEKRRWDQDMSALTQISQGIGQEGQQPQSWADVLPKMKSRQGKALAMQMLLRGKDKGTTVLSPEGQPIMQTRDDVKILQRPTVPHVAPGSLYQDPKTGEWKQAPSAPMTEYQKGQLTLGERRAQQQEGMLDVARRRLEETKYGGPTGRMRQLVDMAGLFNIKPTRQNLDALNKQFFPHGTDMERYAMSEAVRLLSGDLSFGVLPADQKQKRIVETRDIILQQMGGAQGGAGAQPYDLHQGPKPMPSGELPEWW